MKKKLFFLLFLIAVQVDATAQITQIKVETETVEIGENLLTGQKIKAIRHVFPERIYRWSYDTVFQELLLQLHKVSKNGKYFREKGFLVMWDLSKSSLRWARKTKSFRHQMLPNFVIEESDRSTAFDKQTGMPLWEHEAFMLGVLSKPGLGFGYAISPQGNAIHQLKGINLANGKTKWKRKIKRDYGWTEWKILDDSTLLISANGLHSLNIRTGEGWDFDAQTGQKDYAPGAAITAAGVVLGLLTGTFVASGAYNLVSQACSNTLVDSNLIFYADQRNLNCLDRAGNLKWATPLPQKHTSKSRIWLKNGRVQLLNFGFAFQNSRAIDFGNPFFAAFSSADGQQIFLEKLDDESESANFVQDFRTSGDTLTLLRQQGIQRFDQNTGKKMGEKKFDLEEKDVANRFCETGFFIESQDGRMLSLRENFPTAQFFVLTEKQKLLVVDGQLDVQKTVDFAKIYTHSDSHRDRKLIFGEEKALLIEPSGKTVAKFDWKFGGKIIGEKMYHVEGQQLQEVDLSKF